MKGEVLEAYDRFQCESVSQWDSLGISHIPMLCPRLLFQFRHTSVLSLWVLLRCKQQVISFHQFVVAVKLPPIHKWMRQLKQQFPVMGQELHLSLIDLSVVWKLPLGHFHWFLVLKSSLRGLVLSGFGANLLSLLIIPRKRRNSLTLVGGFKPVCVVSCLDQPSFQYCQLIFLGTWYWLH